jgi:hypothetical protein
MLPGLHVRKSAGFRFVQRKKTSDLLIEFGPIKLLTVLSGGVSVCYADGRVMIYSEGRYAFNSVGSAQNTRVFHLTPFLSLLSARLQIKSHV